MGGSTMTWGSIYGPSGGQSVSQRASTSVTGGIGDRLPLALPTLIVLGVLAWWALEKWD